mmetsp:Transcript_21148/g.56456  ORF Transcript_21148/g.56456 Transcript_21148/m.56456 type:complete len:414 (-) Transcript_21148:43-1284(-)
MGRRLVRASRNRERSLLQPPCQRWFSSTASEHESEFAVRDVKQARAARDLMRRAGYPSTAGMSRLLNHGGIINSPVTADDIRRAELIWGPDPASLQGKTTGHSSPIVPTIRPSPVPIGQQIQELHCDLMFVDGVGMLVGVAKPMQLTLVLPIANKTAPSLKRAMTQMVDILAAQLPAGVNITAATEAVPAAERSIRTLKNTMRSVIAGLPFAVPRKLVAELARYAARRLNAQNTSCLPAGLTPHEIFSASIALRPTGNVEGSWRFYNLATGKTCTRQRFTPIPITDDVIKSLNEMRRDESMNLRQATGRASRGKRRATMAENLRAHWRTWAPLRTYAPNHTPHPTSAKARRRKWQESRKGETGSGRRHRREQATSGKPLRWMPQQATGQAQPPKKQKTRRATRDPNTRRQARR